MSSSSQDFRAQVTTYVTGEYVIARLNGASDRRGAFPNHLGEMRRLRVLGVVLRCHNIRGDGTVTIKVALTNFIGPGFDRLFNIVTATEASRKVF